RNPGSSFKPFALVAALESGISLNSWWDSSSPKEFDCGFTCSDRGNIWTVSNAGGSRGGLMRLFDATYNSVNVVYAGLSLEIGAERIVDTAHRMGIQSELAPVPSLALGAGAVSPLEMASAYTNFATNGLWAETYIIESIIAPDGSAVYQHQVQRQQVIDPAIAAAARQPLEIVPVSGTAPRANIQRPQGGKTGTHQNFMEAWFVGFVPQYSTAVWVGFPEEQIPLRNVVINGTPYDRVFGGSVPAPIWKEFMQILLADVSPIDFPPDPEGMSAYFVTPTTTVPDVVAMTEGGAMKTLLNAHLNGSVELVPSLEPAGAVVGQSPEAGASVAEGTTVLLQVSTGLPPEAPLPVLVGLTQPQVIEALRLFEEQTDVVVTVTFTFVDVDNPANVGKVVATNPPAGTLVMDDSLIIVQIGDKVKNPGGGGGG
ncbi:MAG: penicillin-binding transpeptidase domain-containing protein, partial [Acidimicrobiia bacterium]|nr:penicillin-binding transpeptidase domain-containing protein [Acidimicrobiia bacterium]